MRSSYFIYSALCLVFLINIDGAMGQGTGYFALRGKQFCDPQGNEFYPLVCNYTASVIKYNGSPDYYVGPYSHYGVWWEMECTGSYDCLHIYINRDLAKIKRMGFNTIRLNGIFFKKVTDGLPGGILESYPNEISIDPPYNAGIAQIMFSLIGQVIDEAESVGLAVLLDETNNELNNYMTPHFDDNKVDYAAYIREKAKYFRNYKNILAYSYIEEPYAYEWTKDVVCDYSTLLYDASKGQDPNHLITYGGNFYDALSWDPSIVKVDFYSPHLYANWFAPGAVQQYDVNSIYRQEKIFLRYLNKTSPLPWILGETSFKAIDDGGWDILGLNDPPDVHGSVTEQGYFAEHSLDWVRDCGGSGYTWWQFQEVWWKTPGEDGCGLLRHGDLTDPSIDKPAATKFIGYLTNNLAPTPNLSLCEEPINDGYYFDPYNQEALYYLQTPAPLGPDPNDITGIVKDINTGLPIENANAMIVGQTEYEDLDPITLISIKKNDKDHFTFSKDDGSFRLFAFHPHTNQYKDPFIKNMHLSCIGCDVWNEGFCTGTTTAPFVIDGDKSIAANAVGTNVTTSGVTVTAGYPQNFKGQLSLTVSDINIGFGGVSDLTARQEINVKHEFLAERGSETHIYTDENCSSFANYHPYLEDPQRRPKNLIDSTDQPSIELIFKTTKEDIVKILPNPAHDQFSIFIDKQALSESLEYQLINPYGNEISKGKIFGNQIDISVSDLSKGFYLLQITSEKYCSVKKIIIQ